MLLRPARRMILFQGPVFTLDLRKTTLDSRVTFSRASSATDIFYTSSNGNSYTSYTTDSPRLSATRGLLVEQARTNYLLNSMTPATQTTGSLTTGTYTLWVVGSGSAAVAGATATITGAGTASAGTPVTFTVTLAGTVTVTKDGGLDCFQLENGGNPTTLIITTGATATRAVETARVTPIPWWVAGVSSLAVEFTPLAYPYVTAQSQLASVGKGAASGNDGFRLRINGNTNTCITQILNGGTTVAAAASGAFSIGASHRYAAAYTAPGIRTALDGTAGTAEATAVLGTGQDTLGVGTPESTTTGRFGGYVGCIWAWISALSQDELNRITA